MPRWAKPDHDQERLPEGVTRVGYDGDTQCYTYRANDGSIWRGEPGCEYGQLQMIELAHVPTAAQRTVIGESDAFPALNPEILRKERMFAPEVGAWRKQTPPEYQRVSRRFTDFDRLTGVSNETSPFARLYKIEKSTTDTPNAMEATSAAPFHVATPEKAEQSPKAPVNKSGVLSRVKRRFSIKQQAATESLLQRRGTL